MCAAFGGAVRGVTLRRCRRPIMSFHITRRLQLRQSGRCSEVERWDASLKYPAQGPAEYA
jgi:hypothetical protein